MRHRRMDDVARRGVTMPRLFVRSSRFGELPRLLRVTPPRRLVIATLLRLSLARDALAHARGTAVSTAVVSHGCLMTAVAAVLTPIGWATPAAASPEAVSALAVTWGRLGGGLAALISLVGVMVGGLALTRTRHWRLARTVALLAGAAGIAIGGVVLARADGGFGSGHGLAGGIFGVALGLLSVSFAGVARRRIR